MIYFLRNFYIIYTNKIYILVLTNYSIPFLPTAINLPRGSQTQYFTIMVNLRPRPNADLGMHSRDAYPQFADMWVPPGYHIELLRISEYVFPITPGYLASPG